MKIIAFSVRDDEMLHFIEQEKNYQISIEYHKEELSLKNVHLTKGFEGVTMIGDTILDAPLIDALKENGVRYVSTRTIGVNHMDVEYANKAGLILSNACYDPNGVADYTVMLILMALRNYKQALFRGNVNDYSLAGLQGRELRNLTVGIIGTGKIGTAVIKNLSGFGCRMIAYDKYESEEVKKYAAYVPLQELYAQSDVITLHTPLLDSTYHMINKDTIAQMKDGVVLINCARGPLICLKDLISGIETKKIAALGLDVVENEEGIYHKDLRSEIISNRDMAYLRQFPNVIMTQHMAFYTVESVKSMVAYGVGNLVECEKTGTCRMRLGTV